MVFGGEGRQGPRVNLRWIIAIVIALIGIVGYYSRTEVNPVTGEKQRIAMSVDEEKALGLQAAPKMAEQMGGVLDPDRDSMARLVEEVGRKIIAESDARKSPYVGNYNFYLLDDPDTVNAFALPGGQVFITRALLERMENEAQLAGVLGHEIGHVIHRHSAEQMAKGQLGQMLTMAVGVGASGGDDGGRTAQMAAMMANQMMQLRYGRADESESDTYGLRYMAQAGYDPSAMLDVMRILQKAGGGGRQPEFMSSHPLPETRLQEIQALIEKSYPEGIPEGLTKGRSFGSPRSS